LRRRTAGAVADILQRDSRIADRLPPPLGVLSQAALDQLFQPLRRALQWLRLRQRRGCQSRRHRLAGKRPAAADQILGVRNGAWLLGPHIQRQRGIYPAFAADWERTTMFALRRIEFPPPSLSAFVALQCLDILTTMIGLRLGAGESSFFLARLMQTGPVSALIVSKLFAAFLAASALKLRRPRILVFLNYWFAAVVTWNLAMIAIAGLRH